MGKKTLELASLASLAVLSIAAVGFAAGARTGSVNTTGRIDAMAPPLISSAQASPLELTNTAKARPAVIEESAPIYLDLGAKF